MKNKPHISDVKKIAFTSDRGGKYEIYIMEYNGVNQERLTFNNSDDWNPCCSPDCTKIAFSSYRDRKYDICIMDSGGSNLIRLINEDIDLKDDYPSWSLDGSKIAFSREYDERISEIYVMDFDGNNLKKLTDSGSDKIFFFSDNYYHDSDPSWSPDGSKIAFASPSRGDSSIIYIIDADGYNPVRLTNRGSLCYYPSWSPDGSKIAFELERNGNHDIYVMDADGTNKINLTKGDGNCYNPSWSP